MPGDHRDRGQVVRRIEPPGQALRQDQERGADDAAEEVRHLDDAERQNALEQLQPSRGRRRRAREEQDARPARNVKIASTRGVSCSVSAAEDVAPTRATCARRCHTSSTTSADERDARAAAGSRPLERRPAPAGAAAEVRYGLSSSTISPSNTPTPPGTWLTMPSRIATRKTPRNWRNGSAARREQHVEDGAGQRPLDRREQQLRQRDSPATAAAARSVRNRSGVRRTTVASR